MCVAAGRRALPAIPLTTTSTTTSSQRRDNTTAFIDDGHYTDIHWNEGGGGAPRIATWRQSFVDEPGHYNYLEFNQLTTDSGTVEQRQRSSAGYEGLDPAALERLRQPPALHQYAGIGSGQLRSRIDPDGYLEPVEESEDGNHSNLEEFQQSSRPGDHSALRSDQQQSDANGQGYQGLDPSVVEELRRPQRPHSYASIDTSSVNDRSGLHSYLEPIEYSETSDLDNHNVTEKENEGLDSEEVEESRHEENTPQDVAELNDCNNANGQDEVRDSEDYEGLDPVEVEEFRQRARQPRVYAELRSNAEDL